MHRIRFLFLGLIITGGAFAQNPGDLPINEADTIRSEPVIFTVSSASEYIIDLLGKNNLWRPSGDTMKLSLTRLIHQFNEPFDSVRKRLSGFEYDSVKTEHGFIIRNDTLRVRWLNDSSFIINDKPMGREPLILQRTVTRKVADTTAILLNDRLPGMDSYLDSMLQEEEPVTEILIDTAYLESQNIQIYTFTHRQFIPSLLAPGAHQAARFLRDSTRIIISDTVQAIVADRKSPFYILPGVQTTDSLRVAVETLLSWTEKRDSFLLYINDIKGRKTPFWLTSGKDDLYRYWVKNNKNDSITIWMGNPAKHDISLILEEDVNVNRLMKETAADIPITTVKPRRSLVKLEPLKIIPQYWNHTFSSAFGLNQTFLSNWAKGGENSFTGLLDIKATSKYTNLEAKTQWTSSGRLKYGAIITEEYGYRTNNDMLEFNSQYNKVIRDKIDFSTVFYLKTQIAKGYNYPNDSVPISKFLNPGTFTIGLGLEYKPGKKTQINFSALSYKNTFVFDTLNIDQTRHGIAKDRRMKQEMGGQLTVNNSISILEDMNITNSVRLFSGYLDNPGNIDVDWEINLEKKIKWYFKISLNLHLIYDDDIRFEVLDKNNKPVLLPDGSKKKSPKTQFKEFLGLTFTF